jgi:hypothetical protein
MVVVDAQSRSALERQVLAALCAGTREGSVREMARKHLAAYAWSEAAHQTIFEIVMGFPSAGEAALRDQLPARLTRRGFPDFDFDDLFACPQPSDAQAEEWMRQLAD